MEKDTETLVIAAWQDLRQSFPSLTLDWLKAEAEKQLKGELPTGSPGMFLNGYLKTAGMIE